MKRLFSQLHRPLRNERGEITFFACFFVVGVVMLISFLLTSLKNKGPANSKYTVCRSLCDSVPCQIERRLSNKKKCRVLFLWSNIESINDTILADQSEKSFRC